jgi:hypothetical protein
MPRSDWTCTGRTLDGRACNAVLASRTSPRDLHLADGAEAARRDRRRGGWLVTCSRCFHAKWWRWRICG